MNLYIENEQNNCINTINIYEIKFQHNIIMHFFFSKKEKTCSGYLKYRKRNKMLQLNATPFFLATKKYKCSIVSGISGVVLCNYVMDYNRYAAQNVFATFIIVVFVTTLITLQAHKMYTKTPEGQNSKSEYNINTFMLYQFSGEITNKCISSFKN